MKFLEKIWKIINLSDASTVASKAWNALISVGVALGLAVGLLCKIGVPVPGVPCAQVGEAVEVLEEAGKLPETAPTPAQEEQQKLEGP